MKTNVVPSMPEGVSDVVVFAFTDREPEMSGLGGTVSEAVASGFARRRNLDITPVYDGHTRALIVGLGDAKDFSPIRLKRAAGAAVRFLQSRETTSAAFLLPDVEGLSTAQAAYLVTTGAVLGAHHAGLYKTSDKPVLMAEIAVVSTGEGVAEAVQRAGVIAEAANFARDLVNAPANDLTPAEMARRAAEAGREAGLDVEVLGLEEIRAQNMAGILAVNSGSANPPSFTVMKHMPNPEQPPVVLVGKGISFDSGGISIKPGADMHHMKGDMGGAAAVIGAMVAVGRLRLPVNVVGLVPSAENMPDGASYRPSDVLTYANGKTVEITNTDAEGRLILADALIYGEREFQPRAMVDLATLTGSCVVALGGEMAGIFTEDDALAGQLLDAARDSTDPVWRMPLYRPYRTKFDSGTADMQNAGDRWGGSITAALFLAEFVSDTPWAHIDVAGPAFDDTDKAYLARGGTGYGVPLLLEFLERCRA